MVVICTKGVSLFFYDVRWWPLYVEAGEVDVVWLMM